MKIGFLTNNYHTEVLDFLFELFPANEGYEMILYNSHDNYNNWKIYEKIYPNLIRKTVQTFVGDLYENICDKIFIITYENLFALDFLLAYKDKMIIICHTAKSIKDCFDYGYSHITLTPKLLMTAYKMNYNWMLPFTKNKSSIDEVILRNNRVNIGDNKIRIMTIGAFDENNKDMSKIYNLLKHKDIELHIFIMTVTDLVKKLDKQYDNVFVRERISTETILQYIQQFNIQYVLYAPNLESEFVSDGRWSGCISFAYSNNIPLILPSDIADDNNFIGCVTYDCNNDIQDNDDVIYKNLIEFHKSDVCLHMKEIYDLKQRNFNRNLLIRDILIKDEKSYSPLFTNFGIICTKNKEEGELIAKEEYISANVLQYLYNTGKKKKLVVNINSKYGVENLMMSVNKYIQILSVEENLELCKLQKKSNLLNFNNIKIFNNRVSCKDIPSRDENQADIITIDSLLLNCGIDLEHSNITIDISSESSFDYLQGVLDGCKKSINKYKPTFVFKTGVDCEKLFSSSNYNSYYRFHQIDNRIICKFQQ